MSGLLVLQATLKLLSDPTRLRILALLSIEEIAVQELVSITGLAQSRILILGLAQCHDWKGC